MSNQHFSGLIASRTYNGQSYSGVTGGTLAGDSVCYVNTNATLPSTYFINGQFVLKTVSAISGTIGVYVVGDIGGATFIIAGRSNISTIGGFPMPMWNYVGLSGSVTNQGVPWAKYVQFHNHVANVACFTATVHFAGNY